MPTLLITGANRGIGLAMAGSFAIDGWKIHACCRHPERAKELRSVEGNVTIHRLDVADELKIASLARELAQEPIDCLINNAGYYGPSRPFGQTDYDDWVMHFAVNTMGPMRMAEAFASHISASGRRLIVNLSSKMGSVADNSSGGSYLYRSSKCALNMVTKSLSLDLADQGVSVFALHPGWVQTDMGGENALISTAKSVSGLRRVIDGAGMEQTGQFINYDGTQIPW